MKKKNKKFNIKDMLIKVVLLIVMMLTGAVIGVKMVEKSNLEGNSILELVLVFAVFYMAFIIQIILHELGHLIFGLLSGYEFISFRIFSLTFVKENGKLAIKKFSLAGTAGQCLMMPREDSYEDYPYILYNLGGILMNLILVIGSFIIYSIPKDSKYVDMVLISLIGSGIIALITNGIPMKIGGVANDGYNLVSMIKNKFNRYCFYIQLKVNGLMSRGIRVKDMPTEWFINDWELDFSNPLATSIKCIEAAYYHDRLEFDKARECYEFLINYTPKIAKLYENEITCELLFYEIIGEKSEEKINELYTKELKSYIKASKGHISKMRIMYAYNLIIEKDINKAKEMLNQIKKAEKTYPIKSEIESELEIVEFIKDNYID